MPTPGDFKPTNLPYLTSEDHDEDYAAVGGNVERYIAAGNLNVGDVVFFSAVNGVVNKANTAASYQLFAGVVVGGARTTMGNVLSQSSAVGTLAAVANEQVFVQTSGKCFVVSDAAIVAPAKVTGGTVTAGRVASGVSASQGQIIGVVLQAAAGAGVVVLMNISYQ